VERTWKAEVMELSHKKDWSVQHISVP